jgi:DNA-nicking Smr family endonuclease
MKATKKRNKALLAALTDDERALFRDAVEGITPLTQDRAEIPPTPPSANKIFAKRKAAEVQRSAAIDPFSDIYQPLLPEGTMGWVADGAEPYLAKQLRRGDYAPELTLDLHGYTKIEAKRDLAAAIQLALHDNLTCVCVIHGVGNGVLRQQVPMWLAQHPRVRAFHQAPLEWGGHGALLVIVS